VNLAAFVERFKNAVTDAVIQTYPPLYDAAVRESCGFDLGRLLRRPLGGQADAIRATALSIQRHRGTNVVGEMGSGKCVDSSTRVTANGVVMTVEDIWGSYATGAHRDGQGYVAYPLQDLVVPSFNERTGRIELRRVEALWRQQVNESIRRVRLVDGRTVCVTRSHKFLTPEGWTNLIGPGTFVAVPRAEPCLPNARPSVVDSRFMAWLIAEGHERWITFRQNAVAFISQKDRTVLASLIAPAVRLGMTGMRRVPPGESTRGWTLRASATAAALRLGTLGYVWGHRSAGKRVPEFVMQADRESARQFVRAYFDAEGTVTAGAAADLEIMTASEGMAHDLCTLLRRFGIYSRIHPKMAAATNGRNVKRTYFRVAVGGSALRLFVQEIGSDKPQKAQRLQRVAALPVNNNLDTVYVADVVAEAKRLTGLGRQRSGGVFTNVYVTGRQPTMNAVTAESLLRLLEAHGTPGAAALAERVRWRLNADVFFVRVESVEEEPYAGWVYDLEVEGTHNFVANHLLVHNTYIAAAAAYLAGCRRVFVICPPHLVKKWRREILHTVPDARVAVVRTMSDLDRAVAPLSQPAPTGQQALSAALSPPMHVVVCSREQAKLGYRWTGAAVHRPARDGGGRHVRNEAGHVVRLLCCPACFRPALDDEDVPLLAADLERKKVRCRACDGPLWQADRRGPRRYPLADYVRRRFPRHFDLLIVDDVHELKARGSAQGVAGATLAGICKKTLALSGTIFGGYSSTLFYVLWRFSAAIRSEFGYRDEARWVSRYGVLERITRRDDACVETGRQSKRRGFLTRTIEKPGVAPAILFHLIGNTVFLRLSDGAKDLPPYSERVLLVPLDDTPVPVSPSYYGVGLPDERGAPTQARCYHRLASELRQAVTGALRAGSKRLLGTYLQALLTYPDACTQAETVVDPRSGEVIAHAPALPDDVLYPKERALIELVRRERSRQRRVLVYVTHTEKRDLTPRLRAVLEREGFRVAVLKANTVRANLREEWLAARVKEGVDVLLAHPRLVQTGLDLIDWPSLAWYEPEYSVYVMRQASRRSWRIGQRLPVEVTYMVYERTLQALSLVAAKMRSALLIDGELPQDGLAALGTDDQDVFLALARQLAAQADTNGVGDGDGAAAGQRHSLEALFAQARQAEADDEGLLVEGAWEPRGAGDGERGETVPAAAALHIPAGDAAARWSEILLGTAVDPPSPAPRQTDAPVGGRLVTFEQLTQVVRRPKVRPRSVPHGQLTLFNADAAKGV
jgi:hypothetical protein